MIIKILGAGCDKCDTSHVNASRAIEEIGAAETIEIERVEDLITMMKYGVMSTPGIVIDEKVIMVGRIPEVEEFKDMIKKAEK